MHRPRPSLVALALAVSLAACGGRKPRTAIPQASDHVTAGVEALDRGDLDRAEAEFTMALEYDPRMPEALNGVGLVAMARDDHDRARRMFRRAIRENPEFAEGHANLGALDMETGHPDQALPSLRAALDIDPGYQPARQNLARALKLTGRLEEARQEYMKLTSVGRENADAWAELAEVELALGHRAAAGRANRVALGYAPEHVLARRTDANLLRDGGDLAGALERYDVLVKERPSDAALHVDRAVTLLLLGRAADARQGAERAAQLAPSLPSAHFVLGLAATETGDHDRAAAALETAIGLSAKKGRTYPEARYYHAAVLARLGRKKESIAAYKAFLTEAGDASHLAELVSQARAELRALAKP